MKQPAAREVATPVNKALEDAHHNNAKTKKRPERPRSEPQKRPEYIDLPEVDSSMASFLEEKDYRKAVKFIEKAISQSPREPALYSWYGSSLIASNRPYQALQQFRKAAELAPRKPEYQNGIGYSYVYITIDAARQSIEAFRKVLLLDPDNVDALEGLGAIYASVGEKRQASNVYRKLAEKDKDAAKRLHALMSHGLGLGEND
jgi:tetratricopeptide (TPR) repeat protein